MARWGVGVSLGLGTLAGLAALVATQPDSAPSGDAAAISIRTMAAIHGRAFVGPYSQFGWDHPGPLLFYLLAPLYAMSGHHELSIRLTALIINVSALAFMVHLAHRLGQYGFAAVLTITLALLELRAGGDMMFSAWNPHITLLPLAALITSAAAVCAGRLGYMPWVTGWASFLAQSHVGFVPLAGALGVVSLISVAFRADRDTFTRVVNSTCWLLVALWALPLSEQLIHRPGNMAVIYEYFTRVSGHHQSVKTTMSLCSMYLFALVRESARLPLGWAAMRAPSAALNVGLLLGLVATLAYGWLHRAATSDYARYLCGLCVLSVAVALLSIYRIPGVVQDHAIYWSAIVGCVSVAALLARFIIRSNTARTRLVLRATAWTVVCVVTIGFFLRLLAFQRVAAPSAEPAIVYKELYRRAPDTNEVLLKPTGTSWAMVVGVVLQAAKSGHRISVSPELVHVVGDPYAPTGSETACFVLFDPVEDKAVSAASLPVLARVGAFSLASCPVAK